MPAPDQQTTWQHYCATELERATPLLESLGFTLAAEQPHIGGERYLMQAVTTVHGKKLILLGTETSTGRKVVIKLTRDEAGKQEIEHERTCRTILHQINFAYDVFFSPEEILYTERDGFLISIQAFLEQSCQFLDRPIEEQFTYALKAFKAQESVHATTYKHHKLIEKHFGNRSVTDYLQLFSGFKDKLTVAWPDHPHLPALLTESKQRLTDQQHIIDQYTGFLTHVDFVPHNFRIVDGTIYLLDYSSLHFSNKYEGWARFVNFMALYNPTLEQALVDYVKLNRTPEESVALQLMRIFRLGEITWYYTNTLSQCTGNLHTLNTKRVQFWSDVLAATLENKPVAPEIVTTYQRERDELRSADEKARQRGLH